MPYAKLKEITEDIDDARVYGGIHFRQVGEYLYKDFMDSASASSCEGR